MFSTSSKTRRADKALQRTGAERVSFMSHWFDNIIRFGGRALP